MTKLQNRCCSVCPVPHYVSRATNDGFCNSSTSGNVSDPSQTKVKTVFQRENLSSETRDDPHHNRKSVRMAERLALLTSDHGIAGSNIVGGEILSPEPKRRFIAQGISCSPFHRPDKTEIMLKGT